MALACYAVNGSTDIADMHRRHIAELDLNLLKLLDALLELRGVTLAAEQIGIVCPSLERWQAPLETALGTLGVPYALEGHTRLDKTPYGQALLSLLRFAWLGGGRGDLYTFLRSPYSSLTRQNVDFL